MRSNNEYARHTPVLLDEVIEYLKPRRGNIILDATVGCGGHAEALLRNIVPGGSLIGVDQDEEALHYADELLKRSYASSYVVVKGNFSDIDRILGGRGIRAVNGMLFDLGVSSLQLDNAGRGFSIMKNGPLDMRMDRSRALTAYDVVNRYSEDALMAMIRDLGEERHARRIASFIVRQRKTGPITTTDELADLIRKAVGVWYRSQKIHPATRTFQAVRIEVNNELDMLRRTLEKIPLFLQRGGRACVISFHSLEDRIVKHAFRGLAATGAFTVITRKPITPGRAECITNPRSRSAKLRVIEAAGTL
ncbi:MAG: 16S rRNA (cytosine(1402)-N(4))-methyltransferase RsmH [Candidatus Omnitrophica bacterium]|nr:16S rRNA (cytosine(1402)-N(4))-methyltransferase RsmH [Candidatus Omnitrophota bacterium]